jgi:hypothetical protein
MEHERFVTGRLAMRPPNRESSETTAKVQRRVRQSAIARVTYGNGGGDGEDDGNGKRWRGAIDQKASMATLSRVTGLEGTEKDDDIDDVDEGGRVRVRGRRGRGRS